MSATRNSRAFSNVQLESLRYQRTAIPAAGGVMAVDGDGQVSVTSNVTLGTISVTGHASLNTVTSELEIVNRLRATGATITNLATTNTAVSGGLTVGGGVTIGGSLAVGTTATIPTLIVTDVAVTNLILPTTIAQPIGTTLICAPQILAGTTYNVPFLSHYALDVSGSARISKGLTVTDLVVTNQINLPIDVAIDNLLVVDIYGKHILAGSEIPVPNPYALNVVGQAVFEEGVTIYGNLDAVGITVNMLTGITANIGTLNITNVGNVNSLVVGTTTQTGALGVTGQATVGSLAVGAGTTLNGLNVTGFSIFGAGASVGGGLTVDTLRALSTISMPGGITLDNTGLIQAPSALVQNFEVTNQFVVGATAQVIIPTSYHTAVLANKMIAGTTYVGALLTDNYAMDVSGALLVTKGATVSGLLVAAGGLTTTTGYFSDTVTVAKGIAGTTANFTGNATIGGGLTVSGLLVGSSGLTTTSGYFSDTVTTAKGIAGVTAVFSSGMSTNTIQSYSGTQVTVQPTGSVGIILGNNANKATSQVISYPVMSMRNGAYVAGDYGIQIAQTTAGTLYTQADGVGGAIGYNTKESTSGNMEMVVGRGGYANGGGFNIWNTASATATLPNTKIFALDNAGTLTLTGSFVTSNGVAGVTANFSGNATIGGGLTVTGRLVGSSGLTTTTGYFSDTVTVAKGIAGTTATFTGNATIGGGLTVSGLLTAAAGLTTTTGYFSDTVTAAKGIAGTTANFTGNATIGGGLTVTGNATIGGGLTVTGRFVGSAGLTTTTGYFSDTITTAKGIAGTTANFTGDVTIGGGLTVTNSIVTTKGFAGVTAVFSSGMSTNTIQSYSGTQVTVQPTGSVGIILGNNANKATSQVISYPVMSMRNGAYVAGDYGIQIAQTTAGTLYTQADGVGGAIGYNAKESTSGNMEMVVGRGGYTNGGGFNIWNTASATATLPNTKIFALDNAGTLTLTGPLKADQPGSKLGAPYYAWRYQYYTPSSPIGFNGFYNMLNFIDAWTTPSSNNKTANNCYSAPVTGIYSVSAYVRSNDGSDSFACFFSTPFSNANASGPGDVSYSSQGVFGGGNVNSIAGNGLGGISDPANYTAVWLPFEAPVSIRRSANITQLLKLNAGELITVSFYAPTSCAYSCVLFYGHLVCAL